MEDNLMDTTILTSNKSVPVPKGKIINEVEVEETYACIIVEEESVEPSEIREALKVKEALSTNFKQHLSLDRFTLDWWFCLIPGARFQDLFFNRRQASTRRSTGRM